MVNSLMPTLNSVLLHVKQYNNFVRWLCLSSLILMICHVLSGITVIVSIIQSSYSSMLRGDTNSPGVCMLRHWCLGDCYQPVFFSLSLVRDDHNSPSFFVCNILPVLACTCTDSNNEECGIVLVHDCSRQCSGLLKGQNNRLYQICNPSEIFPWCAQLVDTNTGIPVSSATTL